MINIKRKYKIIIPTTGKEWKFQTYFIVKVMTKSAHMSIRVNEKAHNVYLRGNVIGKSNQQGYRNQYSILE